MKNLATIIITTLVLISCNEPKITVMKTTDNEELVKTYFEHFNKHDWKAMAAMYVENANFKDPTLGTGIVKQTHEQIIDKYSKLNSVFPDLNDKVIAVYPSGDNYIIVEFVSSGTAPDNSKFELPICTFFTIKNGLISKDFTYFDNFEE